MFSHVQSVYPGDGGYSRSIIAGPDAGEGGGFLNFTDAALASGKRRLSHSALPSWNPRSFGLWRKRSCSND
ncbi:unnamed protein product [Brassica rapa subsp. trilocularis]